MTHETLRSELIEHYRKLNLSGLNQGTSGNLSVRAGDGFLVTPSGVPADALVPGDVVWMAMDGSYEHPLEPSSEWRFHRDILQAKPDVAAVVHAHPTYSTSLAICGRDIPAIHYMIAAAGGNSIPCAGYATYGTQQLSDAVIEALEGRSACLMANHGMIATGPSLAKALWLAIEVETLARQYFNVLLLGDPEILPDDEIDRVLVKFRNYGLKRPQGRD